MKDYYAILGLDPDASAESIKVAYRRLAREAHPDRKSDMGPVAQAEASGRMAELNEAYAALSNARRRREYDEQLRTYQSVSAPEGPPEAPEPRQPTPPAAGPQPPAPPRARVRPGEELTSSVVREYSHQMRNELLNSRQVFAWREKRLEGFDWALEATFMFSRYIVAVRGFSTADPSTAQKFTNYANVAMERTSHLIKKNYFLFLLPFQRISHADQVSAMCRRVTGTAGRLRPGSGEARVSLIDVNHGRSLLCGPPAGDKRFGDLLQRLKLSAS